MSNTNSNFLLSEVFNVKGKVWLDPADIKLIELIQNSRSLLLQVEEVALALWLLKLWP
jgi:hypothetical protein